VCIVILLRTGWGIVVLYPLTKGTSPKHPGRFYGPFSLSAARIAGGCWTGDKATTCIQVRLRVSVSLAVYWLPYTPSWRADGQRTSQKTQSVSITKTNSLMFYKRNSLFIVMIIWYDICLAAIGSTPGGSSTVHIYTQTVHRTTQWVRIHRTERVKQ
jgi:hypothetical protein